MSAANAVYVSEAVRQIQALYADLTTPEALCAVSIGEGLEKQAARLREAHQRRDPVCCTQILNWHPRLIARPEDELLEADFSLDDAKLTLAREHGFSDWAAVEREGRDSLDFAFEQAVDALLRGDVGALTAGLD